MALDWNEDMKGLASALVQNSERARRQFLEVAFLIDKLKESSDKKKMRSLIAVQLSTEGILSVEGSGDIDENMALKMIQMATDIIQKKKELL